MYNKNKSDLHTVVNGVTSKEEIVNSFKSHFVNVSKPNNQTRVDQINQNFGEQFREATESHSNCSCASYSLKLENVIDGAFRLKKGKCADDSLINAKPGMPT